MEPDKKYIRHFCFHQKKKYCWCTQNYLWHMVKML